MAKIQLVLLSRQKGSEPWGVRNRCMCLQGGCTGYSDDAIQRQRNRLAELKRFRRGWQAVEPNSEFMIDEISWGTR